MNNFILIYSNLVLHQYHITLTMSDINLADLEEMREQIEKTKELLEKTIEAKKRYDKIEAIDIDDEEFTSLKKKRLDALIEFKKELDGRMNRNGDEGDGDGGDKDDDENTVETVENDCKDNVKDNTTRRRRRNDPNYIPKWKRLGQKKPGQKSKEEQALIQSAIASRKSKRRSAQNQTFEELPPNRRNREKISTIYTDGSVDSYFYVKNKLKDQTDVMLKHLPYSVINKTMYVSKVFGNIQDAIMPISSKVLKIDTDKVYIESTMEEFNEISKTMRIELIDESDLENLKDYRTSYEIVGRISKMIKLDILVKWPDSDELSLVRSDTEHSLNFILDGVNMSKEI